MRVLLVLLLWLGALNAESASGIKGIKMLESMQAYFTQKLISEDSVITYTGEFFALAPHFVLWKYQTPIPKEVYINGDSVVVYEPMLEQAIFSALKENIDVLNLIKQAKFIKENHYSAEILGQKYDLFFKEGILRQIAFVDSVGNRVEISFENIQTNHKIDPKLFEFKPTSNLDILYN